MATKLNAYIIQTLGIPAIAEGNIIRLTEKPVEVARAYSGLRMMMLIFYHFHRCGIRHTTDLVRKVHYAAPIAMIANVVWMDITSVVYELVGDWPSVIDLETMGELVHDWLLYDDAPYGCCCCWAR